ncbi:MAG: NTP transferase domain-containing protein [Nanoarchaeota archaeon]|nr:NTP transferase domain-containing protein [Nanoarchaeota archaeon]
MKIVIPLAGRGTRLRPHTHTKPKPLFHIAGKAVLGHILDSIKGIKFDEIIFITGHMGEQIEAYVKKRYDFPCRFIEQKELKGQAHAIWLAREHIKDDVVIWFVDTISDGTLKVLDAVKEDGAIFAGRVDDPERFGVVVPDKDNIVKEILEKPELPPSNLVNIGLYYVKDSKLMFDCIRTLIEKNKARKGEFYLMDAFQMMISKGTKFKVIEVKSWEDVGKPEAALATNRFFLNNGLTKQPECENSVIIPPVYIEDGVEVKNSIIGPYVSVAKGAQIMNSIVKDSIIGKHAHVHDAQIHRSLIGDNALLKGTYRRYNIGDDSDVEY